MTNAAFGKKVLAIAVLACLCAALIAVPAYGFYYVARRQRVGFL